MSERKVDKLFQFYVLDPKLKAFIFPLLRSFLQVPPLDHNAGLPYRHHRPHLQVETKMLSILCMNGLIQQTVLMENILQHQCMLYSGVENVKFKPSQVLFVCTEYLASEQQRLTRK